jgi:hypothetical protein
VDDLEGFFGLVEIGAVELHPWNAKVEDIEHADQIVIDLDPGEGVQWDAVVEAVLRMRDLMKTEGFATWPKLTGGKGIHLMAPLEYPVSHDEAHRTARRLVSALAARFPDDYILSAQAQRRGRIFLDYLRNGRGTTAIGAYTIGGVITPAAKLATIVPENAELRFEVKISPVDIDQVREGQPARVRLTAFNRTTTPEMKAKVTMVSPASARDPSNGQEHYIAYVQLVEDALPQLKGMRLGARPDRRSGIC